MAEDAAGVPAQPPVKPKHQRSGSYGSNHDVADMLGWGMGKKSVPLEWDEDLNPALPGLPTSTDRRRRRCASLGCLLTLMPSLHAFNIALRGDGTAQAEQKGSIACPVPCVWWQSATNTRSGTFVVLCLSQRWTGLGWTGLG